MFESAEESSQSRLHWKICLSNCFCCNCPVTVSLQVRQSRSDKLSGTSRFPDQGPSLVTSLPQPALNILSPISMIESAPQKDWGSPEESRAKPDWIPRGASLGTSPLPCWDCALPNVDRLPYMVCRIKRLRVTCGGLPEITYHKSAVSMPQFCFSSTKNNVSLG